MGSNAGVTAVNRALQRGYNVVYWFNGRIPRDGAESFDDKLAFYPGTPNMLAKAGFAGDENADKRPNRAYSGARVIEGSNGPRVIISFDDDKSPASLEVDQFVFSIGADQDEEGSPLKIIGDGDKIKSLLQPIYFEGGIPTDDLVIVSGFQSGDGLLKVIGAATFRVSGWVKHSPDVDPDKVKDIDSCLQEVINVIEALPPSIVSPEQITAIQSAVRDLSDYQPPEEEINFNVDSFSTIRQYLIDVYGVPPENAETIATKIITERTSGRNNPDASSPHGLTTQDIEAMLRDSLDIDGLDNGGGGETENG